MDDDEYFEELMAKAERTLDDVANDVRNYLSGAVENIIKAGKALQEGRDMHKSDELFGKWCKQEFPDLHRNTRTALLDESDWTQVADTALTTEKKAEWATYRQSLRDLPDASGWPHTHTLPTKPS